MMSGLEFVERLADAWELGSHFKDHRCLDCVGMVRASAKRCGSCSKKNTARNRYIKYGHKRKAAA